jgi:hypothetical protein
MPSAKKPPPIDNAPKRVYNIDEEYENPRLIYYRRGKIKKLGGTV